MSIQCWAEMQPAECECAKPNQRQKNGVSCKTKSKDPVNGDLEQTELFEEEIQIVPSETKKPSL
jgi:hypothetical protein